MVKNSFRRIPAISLCVWVSLSASLFFCQSLNFVFSTLFYLFLNFVILTSGETNQVLQVDTPPQLLPLSSTCPLLSLAPTLSTRFPNFPFPMYPSGHHGFPSSSLGELSSLASLQSNGFCSPYCGLDRCTSHGAHKGPEDSTLCTMTSNTIRKLWMYVPIFKCLVLWFFIVNRANKDDLMLQNI